MSNAPEPQIPPEMLEDFKKEAKLALNELPDEVQKVVFRFTGLAIMAERQRCAKISDEYGKEAEAQYYTGVYELEKRGKIKAARQITEKILEGGNG